MRPDRVYFNLHRKCWSIQDGGTRRVRSHAEHAVIFGVRFRVSEAGRRRVQRERRKNVHAFATGEAYGALDDGEPMKPNPNVVRVKYDPYRAGFFFVAEGDRWGDEVLGGESAVLRGREVWVYMPEYGTRNVSRDECSCGGDCGLESRQ